MEFENSSVHELSSFYTEMLKRLKTRFQLKNLIYGQARVSEPEARFEHNISFLITSTEYTNHMWQKR